MPNELAAHVDNHISHHGDVAAAGISLSGAAIATLVVIYSGGTALLVIGTAATVTSLGVTVGKQIDKQLPEDTGAGIIKTGLDSVRLGPLSKPAARANAEDTKSAK